MYDIGADIQQAFNEGYDEGYDKGYDEGYDRARAESEEIINQLERQVDAMRNDLEEAGII